LAEVLCECKTWYLTLREENGLRVFESRVLRRIFGWNGDKVTGGWRKLHNGDLYLSIRMIKMMKSRRMRWAGYVARIRSEEEVKKHAYRISVGN
jgi:hypothetical protein